MPIHIELNIYNTFYSCPPTHPKHRFQIPSRELTKKTTCNVCRVTGSPTVKQFASLAEFPVFLKRKLILWRFFPQSKHQTINNTGKQAFCPEAKPLVSIQFWVAESESGIRFFPPRQNFAVLPISWLPCLKISFSSFSEKLWEISKI